MTILIVDDVEDYTAALRRALQADHEILTASSLETAQAAMDPKVDLVLTDIRLSEADLANRDGILFLAWLREHFPTTRVLVMSAYRDFDAAVDAVNLGADGYLKKPVNLRELKQRISELVQ